MSNEVNEVKLSDRHMGVVDYFVEQLTAIQASYNETQGRLQQFVAAAAKPLGIDLAEYQLDVTTGIFSPLPAPAALPAPTE